MPLVTIDVTDVDLRGLRAKINEMHGTCSTMTVEQFVRVQAVRLADEGHTRLLEDRLRRYELLTSSEREAVDMLLDK